MSRTEALSYREMCLKFRVKRTEHLLDIIREVESEIESFHAMLDASVIVHQLGDVRISEGDQFLLYLRNLPSKVQEFLQLLIGIALRWMVCILSRESFKQTVQPFKGTWCIPRWVSPGGTKKGNGSVFT